jgi:hypothetical protein
MSDHPLSAKVGLETTEFKTGVADLGRQVRVLESGFKAVAAGMGEWDKTSAGLEARNKSLTLVIEKQKQTVAAYTTELQRMTEGGKASSTALGNMEIKLNNATASLNKNEYELGQNSTALKNLASGQTKAGAATLNLKGQLGQLGGGIGQVVQGLTGMNLGMLGVAGLAAAAANEMRKSVTETLAYSNQVRDLARNAHVSTEEASRMIQVADDLKVEYSTLTSALKAANQEGFILNLDTLAKLSDQYLAIQDPIAKNAFALKNLGKQWQDLTKFLEAGGDKIREMAADQSSSLILTEAQVKSARELEIQTDSLSDSWQGLKYTIGNAVIPTLADLLGSFNKTLSVTEQLTKAVKDGIITSEEYRNIQQQRSLSTFDEAQMVEDLARKTKNYNDEVGRLTQSQGFNTKQSNDQTVAIRKTSQAMDDQAQEIQSIIDAIKAANDATTKYNNSTLTGAEQVFRLEQDHNQYIIDSSAKRGELEDELAKLRKQGYWETSTQVQGVKTSLEKLDGEIAVNKTKFDQASYAIVANLLTQKLAADGVLSDEDMNKIFAYEQSHGLMSQAAIDDWKAMEGEAAIYALQYTSMPDKTITITTNYHDVHTGSGSSGSGGLSDYGHYDDQGKWIPGAAKGLSDFVVPAGYPSDSYRLGLTSGEHVTVTPADQVAQMARGMSAAVAGLAGLSMNVNVNGSAGGGGARAGNQISLGGIHITVSGGGDSRAISQAAEQGVRSALRATGVI